MNAYVHDVVGHGIMGLCHIDGTLIGGPENSLMSGGPGVFSGQIASQLTALDVDASTAVYNSPLNPGATRQDFIEANLINDPNSPPPPHPLLRFMPWLSILLGED